MIDLYTGLVEGVIGSFWGACLIIVIATALWLMYCQVSIKTILIFSNLYLLMLAAAMGATLPVFILLLPFIILVIMDIKKNTEK